MMAFFKGVESFFFMANLGVGLATLPWLTAALLTGEGVVNISGRPV
jgi:hypothetical protein